MILRKHYLFDLERDITINKVHNVAMNAKNYYSAVFLYLNFKVRILTLLIL